MNIVRRFLDALIFEATVAVGAMASQSFEKYKFYCSRPISVHIHSRSERFVRIFFLLRTWRPAIHFGSCCLIKVLCA